MGFIENILGVQNLLSGKSGLWLTDGNRFTHTGGTGNLHVFSAKKNLEMRRQAICPCDHMTCVLHRMALVVIGWCRVRCWFAK